MSFKASNTVLRSMPRGVKTAGMVLAGLACIFFGTMVSSQPTNAEGFLLRTVKCVVGKVLTTDCPTHTPSPVVPVPAVPSVPSPGQSGSPAPVSPSQAPVTQPAPQMPYAPAGDNATRYVSRGVGGPRLDAIHTPVEFVPGEVGVAQGVSAGQESLYQKQLAHLNMYSYYHQNAPTHTSAAILEASREGWRVAGIAWYWWLGLIGGVGGAIIFIKHMHKDKNLKNLKNKV